MQVSVSAKSPPCRFFIPLSLARNGVLSLSLAELARIDFRIFAVIRILGIGTDSAPGSLLRPKKQDRQEPGIRHSHLITFAVFQKKCSPCIILLPLSLCKRQNRFFHNFPHFLFINRFKCRCRLEKSVFYQYSINMTRQLEN